jgi:hypothetical protein
LPKGFCDVCGVSVAGVGKTCSVEHGHEYLKRRGITPGQRNLGWEGKNTQKATRSFSDLDMAWAAGFLEGEGAFTSPHRVDARQVDREPLDRLLGMFGGRICVVKATERWNTCHHWYTSGSRARGIMMTLYPLLSARRQEQIRKALQAATQAA